LTHTKRRPAVFLRQVCDACLKTVSISLPQLVRCPSLCKVLNKDRPMEVCSFCLQEHPEKYVRSLSNQVTYTNYRHGSLVLAQLSSQDERNTEMDFVSKSRNCSNNAQRRATRFMNHSNIRVAISLTTLARVCALAGPGDAVCCIRTRIRPVVFRGNTPTYVSRLACLCAQFTRVVGYVDYPATPHLYHNNTCLGAR